MYFKYKSILYFNGNIIYLKANFMGYWINFRTYNEYQTHFNFGSLSSNKKENIKLNLRL